MSAITVLDKNNTPTGPFTREQIAAKLQTGEISLDALAFVEGLSQWTPLRDVIAKVDVAVPPVAVPPPFTSPAVGTPATTPGYSYAATMQPPAHLLYAGFWLRVAAYLIDALIVSIPIIILLVIFGLLAGGIAAANGAFSQSSGSYGNQTANPAFGIGFALFELVLIVVMTIISWLYYAYLESGPHQATYGKRVMALTVTDMTGQRISFSHASGRFFGKIITGLVPFGIGYMMAGFTERKQALHDLIAGTLVVRK